MRGDELLDVLEHLDADLIEAAAAPQKRTSMVRLVAALAAMLVLVIGIAIMFGEYPNGLVQIGNWWGTSHLDHPTNCSCRPQPSTGPAIPYPPYVLSAATLPQLFGEYDSGSTKQYRTIYAESIEALGIDPFEYAEHLGVYQEQKLTITADILNTFVDQSLLNASLLMGEPLEESERWENIAEDGSYYHIAVDGSNFMARCMFNYTDINELKLYFSSNNLKHLEINDNPVVLKASYSDDEIKDSLSDLLNYVNICLDKNYSEILVRRGALTDSVLVYLYDSEENPFPFDFCWPVFASDYIMLEFYNPEDENDLLYPNELIFMRRIIPLRNSYELLGQSRMLTLDEAEQHLKKGYIFGAHVCKMCMLSQPEVDFSDYDAVALEYVKGDNGLIVPFYAFYKDIGQDSSGRQAYAMTYVAAIEIEGLQEYFASLPANHK